MKIEYSTDNGLNLTEIISDTENDSSYTWSVPGHVSGECKIRIREASDGDPVAESDDTFTIIEQTAPVKKGVWFCVREKEYRLNLPVQKIEVYDLAGEFIKDVPVIQNRANWNGMDENGALVNSGIYFIKLISDEKISFKIVCLLSIPVPE